MNTFSLFLLLVSQAPESFVIEHKVELSGPPSKAYRAISDVARWWDKEHTWSGSAANLSVKAEAGGCFCEKWKDGSVEHGRVIWAQTDKMMRLSSALGPLQELAVSGVLTFALEAKGANTQLTFTYRVSGDRSHNLDKLAPVVDKVLGGQLARLKKFVDTGKPD
jgi:uncharacterized protein YndB with AHSA1/START domain